MIGRAGNRVRVGGWSPLGRRRGFLRLSRSPGRSAVPVSTMKYNRSRGVVRAIACRAGTAAACAAALAGGAAAGSAQQVPPSSPDTVLWVIPELRGPPRSLLSPPPRPVPVVRLGMASIPVTRLGPVLTPPDPPLGLLLIGAGADSVTVALPPPRPPGWADNPGMRFGALGRTIHYGNIPVGRGRPGAARAPDEIRFRNEFADLGFSLRGTGQFGSDWTRYRPCDETVQVT